MSLSISRSYTLVGLTYKDDLTSDPGEFVISATTDNLGTKTSAIAFKFYFGVSGAESAWAAYELSDVLNIPLFLKTSADEILQAHYNDIKGEIENLILNKNHTFS
jgi:hypothetical protein